MPENNTEECKFGTCFRPRQPSEPPPISPRFSHSSQPAPSWDSFRRFPSRQQPSDTPPDSLHRFLSRVGLVPGAERPILHTGRTGAGGMRRRAGVSTPGHGQGEGPGGYKFPRSGDAVDVGRGRSERSERSPARYWQPAGRTSVTQSRGQEGPICTREAAAGRSRGQKGPFCTREAAAGRSRGQEGLFCTREAAASRSRGQEGLFCTREERETAGCGGGRACPPPDTGRGRGPADTSSRETGTQ